MEIVNKKLQNYQCELEDAFRIEIGKKEAKETKDGRKLLNYLRKRRRIINHITKVLEKI